MDTTIKSDFPWKHFDTKSSALKTQPEDYDNHLMAVHIDRINKKRVIKKHSTMIQTDNLALSLEIDLSSN